MVRLPSVGGDCGTWGTILNEFLEQEHDSDGTHGTITPTDIKAQGPWVDVRLYDSINAAVTAIGSDSKTLLIPNAQALTASLTIPSNIHLVVLKGGVIVKASTYTLTINGPFEAGLFQVFSGFAGADVIFGSGAIKEIYPEWWGAKGDGSTDDSSALQKCFDSAYASASGDFKPIVNLIRNKGYASASAIVCKNNINLIMDGPLIYTGSSDETALTVGVSNSVNFNVNLKLNVYRSVQSDWSSEDNIGIKLLSPHTSKVRIDGASGFTIGCQVYSTSGSYGAAYNEFSLNLLWNNKYQIDLNGGAGGWVNENIWIGGRLSVSSSVNTETARYGIRFTSEETYHHNNNLFLKPCFELGTLGIPVLMERGTNNRFIHPRAEGNSSTFMQVSNLSQGNEVEGGYVDRTGIVENGTYSSTVAYFPFNSAATKDRTLLVFDSGYLPHRAISSLDGETLKTHVAGMFISPSSGGGVYTAYKGLTVTDSYLSFSGLYGVGVVIDTSSYKKYRACVNVLTSASGRFHIKCYDENGILLTSADPNHPYVKSNRSAQGISYFAGTFGDCYGTGSDWYEIGFSVHADVKSIHLIFSGSSGLQLTGFKVFANGPANVNCGYEPGFVGANLAYASPTKGFAKARKIVYPINPAAGGASGWVCVQRLDTTVKVDVSEGTSVDVSTDTANLAVNDVVGILLDSGSIHWSTIANITEADTIVINDAVPSSATAGNAIYTMRWKSMANLDLSGLATWNPGSLADGEGETSSSILVSGAALGDFVLVSAPYDLQGITCNGYVDATNSVKIRLQNETGGTIDLGSGTWKVKVIKA